MPGFIRWKSIKNIVKHKNKNIWRDAAWYDPIQLVHPNLTPHWISDYDWSGHFNCPLFLNGSSQNLQSKYQTSSGDMAPCGAISKQSIPFHSSIRPEIRKTKLVSWPFVAPYSFLAQAMNLKINLSHPFMVKHVVVLFIWDSFTITQETIPTWRKCFFHAPFYPLILKRFKS